MNEAIDIQKKLSISDESLIVNDELIVLFNNATEFSSSISSCNKCGKLSICSRYEHKEIFNRCIVCRKYFCRNCTKLIRCYDTFQCVTYVCDECDSCRTSCNKRHHDPTHNHDTNCIVLCNTCSNIICQVCTDINEHCCNICDMPHCGDCLDNVGGTTCCNECGEIVCDKCSEFNSNLCGKCLYP